MEKIAILLVPDKGTPTQEKGVFLDERLLLSPSVAVTESNNATVKMCGLAHQNVLKALDMLRRYDEKLIAEIVETEEILDTDEDKLDTFLVQLSSQSLSQKDSQVVSKMLHAVGDFERLGDHALNLLKSARELHDKEIAFTPQAQQELRVLDEATREILDITHRAYAANDLGLATMVEPLEQVIDDLIAKIRSNHISRLRQGECTIEMGFVLSDILTNYERVSDHCSNIAVAIIEVEHNTFDTHHYLNDIKHGDEAFKIAYADYKVKYALSRE